MFSSIKKPIIVLLLLLFGIQSFGQVDQTMEDLNKVKVRLYQVASSISSPDMNNSQKIQIASDQKAQIESEIKRILQQEKRNLPTDQIHDVAYDEIDNLLLSLTAIAFVKIDPSNPMALEESCSENQGMVGRFGSQTRDPNLRSTLALLNQTFKQICKINSI